MDTTLLKGLQVLDHLARSDRSLRITAVSTDLGLTKSNAYRILKTLEAAGFARQDAETKEFSPSVKLWELGTLVANRLDLKSLAADALRQLAAGSRETVHLAILDGAEVVYIEKIESLEPISAYTRLGGRAPAYCVATGKALLSQLSAAELDAVLGDLKPYSPSTITDPGTLREELAQACREGFAVNRGEWREGVWGVASVVRSPSGSVVAAVGVSGPSFRFDREDRVAALASMVRTAASQIRGALD